MGKMLTVCFLIPTEKHFPFKNHLTDRFKVGSTNCRAKNQFRSVGFTHILYVQLTMAIWIMMPSYGILMVSIGKYTNYLMYKHKFDFSFCLSINKYRNLYIERSLQTKYLLEQWIANCFYWCVGVQKNVLIFLLLFVWISLWKYFNSMKLQSTVWQNM